MSALADIRARLLELADELDRELTAVRSAIAALSIFALPASYPPPPLDLHRCTDCDDAFTTKQGLTMHRTRRHRAAATTATATATAAAPSADADEIALRCEDCDFTAPVGPIRPLAAHVLAEHGRHELLVTERRPRKADG